MDTERDVRTSKRTGGVRSLLSAGSDMAMEVRRKKIRQTENNSLKEKLDLEVRMRDGAYKLLLACSQREQVLNTSKNLLTCDARIKAYLTRLQRTEEEQGMMGALRGHSAPASEGRVPCTGTVAVSGLRIPLMWSDSHHFNNRGSSRRVALFCLMQLDSQVFDTDMVVVDRSVTDVCFEGLTVFKGAVPRFELKVELWSCALEEELMLVNTPKKLAKKLRHSFGKSAGKKLCPLLEHPEADSFLQHNPAPCGARYSLLAHTTLRLPEAEGSFQSHSLVVLQDANWSSWLPLYGNLCCRLVAQPACMTETIKDGYLSHKSVVGLQQRCSLYCVLTAGRLSCYFSPQEVEAKVHPTLDIPINRETRIRVMEKELAGYTSRSMSITNPLPEGHETTIFTSESREDLDDWLEALHQHLYDQGQWLHCCDQLMKIEVASPRKPSLFLAKQADCVYNDLSINSPGKFEGITDIIRNKIEETDGRFLIGCEEGRGIPNWSCLFEGSVVVQNKTSTPCSSPHHSSSTPSSSKKRRAPPPPPDREPYAPPTRPARPPLPACLHHPLPPYKEKENSNTSGSQPATRSKTGRPSLDAKFSAIIQQLQRNNTGGASALSRRNAPLGVLDIHPQSHQAPPQQVEPQSHHSQASGSSAPHAPIPAPRSKARKSFRERVTLKAL